MMYEGSKGEGNRIAQRDYYEFRGSFPCTSCEQRWVKMEDDICRHCRELMLQKQRERQGSEALLIWMALSALFWSIGFYLFDISGFKFLAVCVVLGLVGYFALMCAAYHFDYWLQQQRE